MAAAEARTLRTVDLLGVFWRSFFIQSSWSYARMQSLGFAFALIPVLRRLYPDRAEYAARLGVHLEYFNTQPYLASFLLGAVARKEEQRAAGWSRVDEASAVKKALMAPLGALGDSYFWGGLKPLAASVAVAALLSGAWWAPLLFLALYNVAHVGMRGALIFAGYATGGDVAVLVSRFHITHTARVFKVLALSVIGCIAGTAAFWDPLFRPVRSAAGPAVPAAAMAAVLGLSGLLRIGGTPVKLMIGLAAFCLALVLGGFWAP
jgi:mannose/fructose/N-acetylgalactosamine-specific phosphotransferase system component IID